MNQPMNAKTIVFAIKIADLLFKIATASYMEFPARVPIVVDLRIARVTYTSGLLTVVSSDELEKTLRTIESSLEVARDSVLDAWAAVSESAGDLSLLRIDSLVWQVAEPIFQMRGNTSAARNTVASTLTVYGAREDAAKRVATELTYALR
jgi:N-glycosylase/DNA lyase